MKGKGKHKKRGGGLVCNPLGVSTTFESVQALRLRNVAEVIRRRWTQETANDVNAEPCKSAAGNRIRSAVCSPERRKLSPPGGRQDKDEPNL